MKKNNLYLALAYFCFGLAMAALALFTETRLESLIWGLAGAGMGPGALMIWRYFYWSAPARAEEYAAKLETERIERHDELKEKLRDRAGRYAYIWGIAVTSGAMLLFSLLDALEVITDGRIIILYLGGYLLFQLICGWIIFYRLAKRYYA